MSRFLFLLILIFLAFLFSNFQVYAAEPALNFCPPPIETDPKLLLDTQRKAKFTIGVGKTEDFSKWKVEFKCGVRNKKEDAVIEDRNKISYTLDQTSYRGLPTTEPCEFSEGFHTIEVIAVNSSDVEVKQCKASYQVLNGTAVEDAKCKLSIDPTNGITSSTILTLKGEDLRKDGRFIVFFDNTAVDFNPLNSVPGAGNVNTPIFSMTIPQALLTPGDHTITLRKKKLPDGLEGLNPLDPNLASQYAGPPLCRVALRVGTPSNPGSVLAPGTGTSVVPGPPTTSGGPETQCGTDKDPGIKTAIGCIHTQPAALVKDLLTFVIGVGGGLAFLMMLLGAFQMLTSAGNPETLSAGRDRLQSAIIGLLFVIFAVLLLQIIGFDILNLPGFGR